MNIDLRLGDCIEVMRTLPDNSVDSVITDPPYGIGFMNKEWDSPQKHKELIERETKRAEQRFEEGKSPAKGGFSKGVQPGLKIGGAKEGKWFQEWCELWAAECYRVLKPGGYILSFSAPRTYHRMATAFEDVGFEIRDQIMWLFGSGFPKSHNIGKAIDKLGIENNEWKSWGSALKPAHEPICMARKPLSEKSIAENVLKHGTGGINIDGSRIGFKDENDGWGKRHNQELTEWKGGRSFTHGEQHLEQNDLGRFPANLIIECICDDSYTKPAPASGHWSKTTTTGFGEFGNGSSTYEGVGEKESGNMVIHTNPECPCYMLDQQSGVKKSIKRGSKNNKSYDNSNTATKFTPKETAYTDDNTYGDTGGASRFFYSPKVSKKERNAGLEELPEKEKDRGNALKCGNCGLWILRASGESCKCGEDRIEVRGTAKNHHPTVKPKELMKYLIKLVSPPNAVILEPFLGSGSTGVAAKELGFISTFIGIEKEEEYMEIAKKRIDTTID
jgi:site-specific DNA-methyltransferase (adenine-specific)